MPRISAFHGITIAMFWNERDHPIAHFHAEYAGHKASVSVDGLVLAGELPARQRRLVQYWAELHQEELMLNWERGRNREPFQPIEPLA
jgi:hypothetical protein